MPSDANSMCQNSCALPFIFVLFVLISKIFGYFCPLKRFEDSISRRDIVLSFAKEANKEFAIGFWSTFSLFRHSEEEIYCQPGLTGIIIEAMINGELSFVYGADCPTANSNIFHQFLGIANDEIYHRH